MASFLHTLWQCYVYIHNQMLIFNAWVFYLRIKRAKYCLKWGEKGKISQRTKDLNCSVKPDFFFKACLSELEFLYSFSSLYFMFRTGITSLSYGKSTIFPYAFTNEVVRHPPSPSILKFLAEKRSVKTGYLYFYWFLQTMTTFPERQCQETINVCEKEVKVLISKNCLVPHETAA